MEGLGMGDGKEEGRLSGHWGRGGAHPGQTLRGWGRDQANCLAPTEPLHPHPSFAGSWRSASERASSATRRRCARCCRCASAAGRAPRPRPPAPRRSPRPPREPCSAWCRGRPGRRTGRCRCWRASSRLSLASRGACPAEAASEHPAPLPPAQSPAGVCLVPPRPPGGPSARGSPAAACPLLLHPMPALLVRSSAPSSVQASLCWASLLQSPGALGLALEAGGTRPLLLKVEGGGLDVPAGY